MWVVGAGTCLSTPVSVGGGGGCGYLFEYTCQCTLHRAFVYSMVIHLTARIVVRVWYLSVLVSEGSNCSQIGRV